MMRFCVSEQAKGGKLLGNRAFEEILQSLDFKSFSFKANKNAI